MGVLFDFKNWRRESPFIFVISSQGLRYGLPYLESFSDKSIYNGCKLKENAMNSQVGTTCPASALPFWRLTPHIWCHNLDHLSRGT